MSDLLGTITVTDKWTTVGVLKNTSGLRRIAIYVDRFKRDSKNILIRINAIDNGMSFPFHASINKKDEITLTPKHYKLDDDTLNAFFIEELYEVVGELSIQVMAEKVGEKADEVTIRYTQKLFKQ